MKAYKMALPENMEERHDVSRRVQEYALAAGRMWAIGKIVQCLEARFLYFDNSGGISYGLDMAFFIICDFEEITPESFLALPIPEESRDFMSDFASGKHVVGEFRDEENEFPALGVLYSYMTRQARGGPETCQYSTSGQAYRMFTPIESFDSAEKAESFIRARMEKQAPPK